MQVELQAHPGMTAQIMEIERVLRLLPSCITGDSSDVRHAEQLHNEHDRLFNMMRHPAWRSSVHIGVVPQSLFRC